MEKNIFNFISLIAKKELVAPAQPNSPCVRFLKIDENREKSISTHIDVLQIIWQLNTLLYRDLYHQTKITSILIIISTESQGKNIFWYLCSNFTEENYIQYFPWKRLFQTDVTHVSANFFVFISMRILSRHHHKQPWLIMTYLKFIMMKVISTWYLIWFTPPTAIWMNLCVKFNTLESHLMV